MEGPTNENPSHTFMLKMPMAAPPLTSASQIPGISSSRTATHPIFLKT
jgi:hypothetical protein